MDNLLSGFIGAILGGLLAIAGSFLVGRHEFIRKGRVEIIEGLLPELTAAVKSRNWPSSRAAMRTLSSKSWMVSGMDQLFVDDIRLRLNELTGWDHEAATHTDPGPVLTKEEDALYAELVETIGRLRQRLHEKLAGRTAEKLRYARLRRRYKGTQSDH